MMEVCEMKYLGEYNNPLHPFVPESIEKKHTKLKTKVKTYKVMVMPCIWSRNLLLQSKVKFQTEWNSIQTTQDHFRKKLAEQNLTC